MLRNIGGGWFIGGIGVMLAVVFSGYLLTHRTFLQGPMWLLLVGIFIVGVLSVSLLYGGYWLSKNDYSSHEEWQICLWVMVGLVGTVALVFWPIFYQGYIGNQFHDPIFILLSSAGIGLNAGLISGIYDIQSRRRLDRVQNARESLTFVNRLLRHDISNAVTVIHGRSELLNQRDSVDDASVETIQQQCESISDLIAEARMLSTVFSDDADLEPVNLRSVVKTQLSTTKKVYNDAEVDVDIPSDMTVQADSMLNAIVTNLVSNGIEHNDSSTPHVSVSVEKNGDYAHLKVEDNGPGIDSAQTQAIFEPTDQGENGMGMYLVKTLTERYGGDVWIDESQLGGALVAVELPLAA